jgi:hypothetical protein
MKTEALDSALHDRSTAARFAPVLAPILRRPLLSLVLAASGTGQVFATIFHAPAMRCPVMELFHVPCPGCGVSRACAATLQGEWSQAIHLHAFAPLFLVAILLFWLAAALPAHARQRLAGQIESFERRTALPTLLLITLILYWIVRLLYAPVAFIHLVSI